MAYLVEDALVAYLEIYFVYLEIYFYGFYSWLYVLQIATASPFFFFPSYPSFFGDGDLLFGLGYIRVYYQIAVTIAP